MQDNYEIEHLLTNIQKSLKIYSVRELNNALKDIISYKDSNKKDDINYSLNLVCEHFKITITQLMGKDNRGTIIDAKQIAYCLLYFDVKLSVKNISKSIFHNWRNSVYRGINRFKDININIKEDEMFLSNYNILKQKFIVYKNTTK
jgi:chromosomal replication initiation ATPase DnaA